VPGIANRAQQARSEEQQEFPIVGPFAGILSEMSPGRIERYGGFLDLNNIMLQDGRADVRPGWTALTAMPNPQESIMGVADFFDNKGARHQVIFTPTRMLLWNGAAATWTVVAGVLNGTVDTPIDWAVVNYKLCFSQGVNKVQVWDGNSGNFAVASANAVAAKYMMELSTYLLVANTVEAGTPFPQRIRYTSPGDTSDWISLSAGVEELINDLGPINHLVKLYQSGYAIHQLGITQIIPTGNGLNPFNFVPISSNNHGTPYPNAVGHQGGELACFPGSDNVYMFDGTTVTPIGDMKVSGSRDRLGARDRILTDLQSVLPNKVYGYISTFVGTSYFNAYWLAIPGISTWAFNFDEQNWTRFSYNKQISTIGRFNKSGVPRIMDLSGPILGQNWSPLTLAGVNPLDGILLGFNDGTPAYVDFTNVSELPWSITSGQHFFGDLRHQKNVKKFRIVVFDRGQIQFTLTVTGVVYPVIQPALDANGNPISTNQTSSSQTKVITMGNGSGQEISRVVEFAVPGQYITWKITGAANVPASFVEITPIFDIGGEQRGG